MTLDDFIRDLQLRRKKKEEPRGEAMTLEQAIELFDFRRLELLAAIGSLTGPSALRSSWVGIPIAELRASLFEIRYVLQILKEVKP